jgi:hypothetical protein
MRMPLVLRGSVLIYSGLLSAFFRVGLYLPLEGIR